MDRPRNAALKKDWTSDRQIEEVKEVEHRWHGEGEQADALWSVFRWLESLVEEVSRQTSQQCAREEEEQHMLVKSGHHQASVQCEDERKHSHWQPPTS